MTLSPPGRRAASPRRVEEAQGPPSARSSFELVSPRGNDPGSAADDGKHRSRGPKAGILSRLTFHGARAILRVGFKRPLQPPDIPPVDSDISVEYRLADLVQSRLASNIERGDKYPLWWAIYDAFRREFWIGGACRCVADVLLVATPYTLRYLIQFVTDSYQANRRGVSGPPLSHGIGFLVGIAAMLIIQTLANNHFMYLLGIIGGQARAVLVSSIFDKALRIEGRGGVPPTEATDAAATAGGKSGRNGRSAKGKAAESDHTIGRLTNFLSVDCARIDRAAAATHFLWTAPLSVCLAVTLLIINLRVSALAGLGLLFLGFVTLITAVGTLFQMRKGVDKETETRVSLIQEVLAAIQSIKYLAWEDSFIRRISGIRDREVQRLHQWQAVRNVVGAVSQSLPVMTAMVSFATYAKVNGEGLSPAVVFSSVALFSSLRMPVIYLPICIQGTIDCWAALLRIEAYLLTQEPEPYETDPSRGPAAEIKNATFSWQRAPAAEVAKADAASSPPESSADVSKEDVRPSTFLLRDISLELQRGELVAVIGAVGAGKTALLSALMGDMTRTAGTVIWGCRYASCAQQPWIQNTTVRNNIVFGQPFDEERYREVVAACSMTRDLELLAHGDATMVGERGVVLSGGQKQRISLARALYSPASVLLLDDPLSAVDANVGPDIIEKGICGPLAADRTRVICTHDMSLLPRCDRVVWIDQGRVLLCGSYSELLANEPKFASLVAAEEELALKRKADKEQGHLLEEPAPGSSQAVVASSPAAEKEGSSAGEVEEETGIASEKHQSDAADVVQDEDRAVRAVPWTVYTTFARWSNSPVLLICSIPVLGLAQGSTVMSSLWLAWWSGLRFPNLTTNEYIGIYASLAASQAIFVYFFGFMLSVCCTRASQRMLRKAIASVLRAPISFFDATPLGRHTNRFSTDVEVTDIALPEALRVFFLSLCGLVAIFAIVIVYFNWFAIAAVALIVFLGVLANYYRATARELKRLESTMRSVVFVRFIEGIKGAPTVRTYRQDDGFRSHLRRAMDDTCATTFTMYAVQRWLSLRQDTAATVLMVVMGILVLAQRHQQQPAIAGLVLSLMLNVVQVTQVVVREWADVEGAMNAVERLYAYAVHIPQEALGDGKTRTGNQGAVAPVEATKAHSWLTAGEVRFHDVRLRYRPGLPESLKGVELTVRAGEHVAIVGRTGAGKSSIINALFRMTELSGGNIAIDGTDIAGLPLAHLRGALSIIPQEATLFAGTIRSNLDPSGEVPDEPLRAAIQAAAGPDTTMSLDDAVQSEGTNLSQGQRQLLALARVLLRDHAGGGTSGNRVLVCDEATASLDTQTDQRIQSVIRTAFRDRTILCVAHRLRTVLWYDRVCVMETGRVVESGSPLDLFRAQGKFWAMCMGHHIQEDEVVQGALLAGRAIVEEGTEAK